MPSIPGLQNQITQFTTELLQNKINQYLSLITIPIEIIKNLILGLFNQIIVEKKFDPISLVKEILISLKDQIIAIISPKVNIEPKPKFTMSIAIVIVFLKYLFESIIKVLVGSFLGKGKVAEGLAALLFQ